jgi:hypothetical protein
LTWRAEFFSRTDRGVCRLAIEALLQRPASTAVAERTLRSGHAQKQESWREVVAAALAPRLTTPDEPVRQLEADALSGSAIACLMAALADWLGDDGHQALGRLLDVAMSAVVPLADR